MVFAWPCTRLPSSICWRMCAGLPVNTACESLLSWSKLPTPLSPSRCIVPWSICTLRVRVMMPLSWFITELSALTWMGCSLSDCFAWAVANAKTPAIKSAIAGVRRSRLASLRCERGMEIGEQLQRVGIQVGLHADAAHNRAGLLNDTGCSRRHALVLRPDRRVGRMHLGGLDLADRGPVHVHLADQLHQRVV